RLCHCPPALNSGVPLSFRDVRLFVRSSLWFVCGDVDRRPGWLSHLTMDGKAPPGMVPSSFQHVSASSLDMVRFPRTFFATPRRAAHSSSNIHRYPSYPTRTLCHYLFWPE